MLNNMPPVTRGPKRPAAPSRRPATPPAQQRRTAASAPSRRPAAAEAAEAEDETTAFDAGDEGASDDGNGTGEYDPENLPTVLDLSGIEPASFEVVPRGWYEGYIDSVEYGLSQNKGLPMLTFILKFDYGEDQDGNPKERTLRSYMTLDGDGAPRSIAALAKLDPDLDFSDFHPEEMDDHFSGAEVNIQVTIRPDRENKKLKRNNVADIVPLEEAE